MRALFALISLSIFGFGSVRIALAANVSYVMPELITAFKKHNPNIRILTTIGGSGKLATQIRGGAPYDLFLSANIAYPQALFEAGMTTRAPVVYAQGALILLSRYPRDMTKALRLLTDPTISKIAVANPRTAPYGKAAFEAMKNAGILDRVRSKLAYGESIAQTVAYALRAADIGIVAKSALFAPRMSQYQKGSNWTEIDPKLYHPIDQGLVMIKGGTKEAKQFYDFLLSPEAKEIFRRYGYIVP